MSFELSGGNTSGKFRVQTNNAGAINTVLIIDNCGAVQIPDGPMFLTDCANDNMTKGITINQDCADNFAFALKSSDIATGFAGNFLGLETDDFFTISKTSGTLGGVTMAMLGEDGAMATNWNVFAMGGTAETADGTGNIGLVTFNIGEHNGSNTRAAPASNSNLFVIREYGTSFATRLILKSDDGELHLGNTTLVALDGECDAQAVRALQRTNHNGRGMIDSRWERPVYSHAKLHEMGVVGERDEDGQFLIRVQPYLALHDGAIWQLYTSMQDQQEEITALKSRLHALTGVNNGDNLYDG